MNAANGKKAPKPDGKFLFDQHCACCHAGGGNAITPSRPLKDSKRLANIGAFKEYLSAPPGHMPYYEDVVKNPEVLQKLYDYCKHLKTLPIRQSASTGKGLS